MTRRLDHLLLDATGRAPGAPAVRAMGRETGYRQLDEMSATAAAALAHAGVRAGDRVGLWLDKSAAAIAIMQGALRLGAAYVPVDPANPVPRATAILEDCAVSVVVTSDSRAQALAGGGATTLRCLCVEERDDGLHFAGLPELAPFRGGSSGSEHDLAYILYTSGSTGRPKGVCISHLGALAFVDWAVTLIDARPDDRFANHAPFHFDLSVLDIYAALSVGACLSIVPESFAYAPGGLVDFLVGERISIWYSVPSALVLMMERGKLLEVDPLPLRHLLFAGEPFPIRYVRALRERWPALPLHNLYGPTETNVCTAYSVTHIEPERTRPVPIGSASCGDRVWAVTEQGHEAGIGEEGELWVKGPTVMLGYWGRSPQGDEPYRTGDLVRRLDEQNYDYIGRRDQMLKVRGHRIEAGDIESCLLAHAGVREVAVVVAGEGLASRLVAFLVSDGAGASPSLIALKGHCAAHLPKSMIIDTARWIPEMPRTGNGKIDRLKLKNWATEPESKTK